MVATITAGSDAIAAALTAASIRNTTDPRTVGTKTGYGPPVVVILGNGSTNLTALGRVGIRYEYRLVCVGAVRDAAGDTVSTLRTLVLAVLGVARDLSGFTVDSLGPESEGDYAGGKYLAADIIVTTYVAI